MGTALLLSGLKWPYCDLFRAAGVSMCPPLVVDRKGSIPAIGDVYLFPFAALLFSESGT